jgi:hypothetical protein|nr:MAG TPA: hypothetical protein [Bacteriophage sp.]
MEVQTFMTDLNYRKDPGEPELFRCTNKWKHGFLTELFRSLREEESKGFKVINGIHHTSDGYKIPYQHIEFSDIHEFERIIKNINTVFVTKNDYQTVLNLIEKVKRNEEDNIYFQFEFSADPIASPYLEKGDILRFKFSYNKPKIPGKIAVNDVCRGNVK